jgi:hypothetical protein
MPYPFFNLNTNQMYRPEDIKTGLKNLCGWRQNYNTSDFSISNSLTVSESGQFYQDFHPLITLENVKAIAPDFVRITLPTWNIATQYRKGDRVSLSTVDYRATQDNLGLTPDSNTDSWEPFDAFSEWLEQKTMASILKAIGSFWSEKISSKTAKNILESKTIFNGTGRITDLIPNESNFVGFEITPMRANGVVTKLEKIGLQFTGTDEIKVYLMHSSQVEPVKEATFQRTKSGSMEWFDLQDWFLPYSSTSIDTGGSWYLVYDQSALETSQAVRKDKDWSKKPCTTCDTQEVAYYDIWSKYIEFHPFKIAGVSSESPEMWDVSKNLYTYSSNYGLNLQLTIECDVTDLIVQQKKAFQNVIGYQVAADMLREFAYNPSFRINRSQLNFSRMELLYELDGDSQSYKKSGLVFSLAESMKAVKLDFTNMSRICFQCGNGGVRFRTI